MTDIIREACDAGIVNVISVDAEPTRQGEINAAKAQIKLAVRARYIDLPIASIEVSDEDAERYLDGATIDELLA
jgi:hypothetical protein